MSVETTVIKKGKATDELIKALSCDEIREKVERAESLLSMNNTNDMKLPEIKYFISELTGKDADIANVIYEAFCFGYCQGYEHNEEREG